MATTELSHDAFDRWSLLRRTVHPLDRRDCATCGQPARFQYGTEQDGINTRPYFHPRQFCSVGCYRDFTS